MGTLLALMQAQAIGVFPHTAPICGGFTEILFPEPPSLSFVRLQKYLTGEYSVCRFWDLFYQEFQEPTHGQNRATLLREWMPLIEKEFSVEFMGGLLKKALATWGACDKSIAPLFLDYANAVAEEAPEIYSDYIRSGLGLLSQKPQREALCRQGQQHIALLAKSNPKSAEDLAEWLIRRAPSSSKASDILGGILPGLEKSLGQKWALDFALRAVTNINLPPETSKRTAASYDPYGFIEASLASKFCALRLYAASATERLKIAWMVGRVASAVERKSPELSGALNTWNSRYAKKSKGALLLMEWASKIKGSTAPSVETSQPAA